jgi:hypothetical protein
MAGCTDLVKLCHCRRWLLLPALLLLAVLGPAPGVAEVPADDVLVEVVADTDAPYVRARVRYWVRVLARVPLRGATLTEPKAEGALIRRVGKERSFETRRGGRDYRVIERLYLVVAKSPGALRILGPTLSAAVPLRALEEGADDDSLLERRALVSRTGRTLQLDVQSPPAAAESPWLPAEAVSISEYWEPDLTQVERGEPVTRRLVIEAAGVGVEAIELPELPETEGLLRYPGPIQNQMRERGDDLLLTTVVTHTFVPTMTGLLQVPALRLPWWSLGSDAPRQAMAPARELIVGAAQAAQRPDEIAPTQAAAAAARARFVALARADLWGAGALSALLGAMLLVALTLAWRARRRRANGASAATDAPVTERLEPAELRRRFREACGRNDAPAARRALAAWVRTQRRPAGVGPGVKPELRARGAGDQVLAVLDELERCAYGQDAAPWRGEAALRLINPLLDEGRRQGGDTSPSLPPLFPSR